MGSFFTTAVDASCRISSVSPARKQIVQPRITLSPHSPSRSSHNNPGALTWYKWYNKCAVALASLLKYPNILSCWRDRRFLASTPLRAAHHSSNSSSLVPLVSQFLICNQANMTTGVPRLRVSSMGDSRCIGLLDSRRARGIGYMKFSGQSIIRNVAVCKLTLLWRKSIVMTEIDTWSIPGTVHLQQHDHV